MRTPRITAVEVWAIQGPAPQPAVSALQLQVRPIDAYRAPGDARSAGPPGGVLESLYVRIATDLGVEGLYGPVDRSAAWVVVDQLSAYPEVALTETNLIFEHVKGAGTAKPPSFWESLRLIGTGAGKLKMAGTFLYHGEVVFFDYAGDENVLVIDLVENNYKHLFVHVDPPDTPEAAAARIQAALAPA